MLLDDVVAAIEASGIPCRRTVYVNVPSDAAFAVWGDAVVSSGAAERAVRHSHTSTILLAERQGADGSAVGAVDAVLDAHIGGMSTEGWSRREREWDEESKVYTTEYTFRFVEKVRTA